MTNKSKVLLEVDIDTLMSERNRFLNIIESQQKVIQQQSQLIGDLQTSIIRKVSEKIFDGSLFNQTLENRIIEKVPEQTNCNYVPNNDNWFEDIIHLENSEQHVSDHQLFQGIDITQNKPNTDTYITDINSVSTSSTPCIDSIIDVNTIETSNHVSNINWKLIPLQQIDRPKNYYARRNVENRKNVLKEVTNSKKVYTNSESWQKELQQRFNWNVENNENELLNNSVNYSNPIEQIPHLSVSTSKKKNSKINQNNENEYFLVASQIDPMFYGEPSTSSFNENLEDIETINRIPNNIEELNMSPRAEFFFPNFTPASPSVHSAFSSSHENPPYSLLLTPDILISPLKPFNEYSDVPCDEQVKQNSNSENKENKNYNDDFYGFESDSEVTIEPNNEINEVTIEELSEEDGEITYSPTSITCSSQHSKDFSKHQNVSSCSKNENQSPARKKYRLDTFKSPQRSSSRRYSKKNNHSNSKRSCSIDRHKNRTHEKRNNFNERYRGDSQYYNKERSRKN